MMIQHLGFIFAGIGFCCLSSVIIAVNMQQLASFSLQQQFNSSSSSHWSSAFIGIISGFFTQTASLQAYLVTHQASSQRKQLEKTLTMINWNCIGMCLLVFVFLIYVDPAIPYLIGIIGVVSVIFRETRFQQILNFLLGLVFLYFGVILIKTYSGVLLENETSRALIKTIQHSYFLAFLLGALFTGLTQTFIASAVLAIVFAQGGLLELPFSAMVVMGSQVGLGMMIGISSFTINNYTRRSITALGLYHLIAALIGIILIYLETVAGIPLLGSVIMSITNSPGIQVALFVLCVNILSAALLFLFKKIEAESLVAVFPAEGPKEYSSPRYLSPVSLEDPTGAVSLLELEYRHLTPGFNDFFENMRRNLNNKTTKHTGRKLHEQYQRLFSRLSNYTLQLTQKKLDEDTSKKLIQNTEILKTLSSLEGNIYSKSQFLEKVIKENPIHENFYRLADIIIEAEDAVFMVFCDAIKKAHDEELEILFRITEERENIINKIRDKYIYQEDVKEDPTLRSNFLFLTSLFEQDIWLMRKIARSIAKQSTAK